jgi:hypothetical protein
MEVQMKTFLISYITSVLAIIFISYPSVEAAPFVIIPRVFFYYGFPMAVGVSIVALALAHLIGFPGYRKDAEAVIINRAQVSNSVPSQKAA